MSELPIIVEPLTPEEEAAKAEWEAGEHQREIDAISAARHAAYTAPNGSDAIL